MNDHQSVTSEVGAIAFRSSVGVGMSAFTLNTLVTLLTAIFLLMQMTDFALKRQWPGRVWRWLTGRTPPPPAGAAS